MYRLYIILLAATVAMAAENKTINCGVIPKVTLDGCCPMLDELGQSIEDDDCTKNLTSDETRKKDVCEFSKCLLSKKKLLSPQNTFDYVAFRAFIKTMYPKSPLTGLEDGIKKCIQRDNSKRCDAEKLVECVYISLFLNCPDDVFQKTPDCTEIRSYLEVCPPPFDGMDK